MRKEAKTCIGRHNFKSFTGTDPSKKDQHTIRTIKCLDIKKKGDLILIEIAADGFLYKMVRNIVGTLLNIGTGRLAAGSIKKILKAKTRKLVSPPAPAHGLTLLEVKY
jgi:tRNA pseudouridine38-40 synthase